MFRDAILGLIEQINIFFFAWFPQENIPCPKSPDKLNTVKSKRRRPGEISCCSCDFLFVECFPIID
jgi:hypothetical protein